MGDLTFLIASLRGRAQKKCLMFRLQSFSKLKLSVLVPFSVLFCVIVLFVQPTTFATAIALPLTLSSTTFYIRRQQKSSD